MMRQLRGLRRTLATLATLGVLTLPAAQLAHAEMMVRMGMMPCDGTMVMPMPASAPAPSGPQQQHAEHHGCCCDCCSCCVEAVVLPSPAAFGIVPLHLAVLAPVAALAGAAAPQFVEHRLPFSLPPPSDA